jgi:hypothetical protein
MWIKPAIVGFCLILSSFFSITSHAQTGSGAQVTNVDFNSFVLRKKNSLVSYVWPSIQNPLASDQMHRN